MFQCPICGELMEALTNVHCLSRHLTSKQEVVEQHGVPKYVTPKINREVQQWIREAQVITKLDFDVAQAAARTLMRKSSTSS